MIVDDKLGLADTLERDIQRLIDSYECEWSRTLNEEQALQRFSHFINSDKRDPDVQFVSERDQHRPATPRAHPRLPDRGGNQMMKLACQLNDIMPGTGVCALLEGHQNMPVSLDVEVQS